MNDSSNFSSAHSPMRLLRFLWLVIALTLLGTAIADGFQWAQSNAHREIGLLFDWVKAGGAMLALVVAWFLGSVRNSRRILCSIVLSVLLSYYVLFLLIGGEGWWGYRYVLPLLAGALCVVSIYANHSSRTLH